MCVAVPVCSVCGCAGVQCVWLYRCAVCVAVPVCSVCSCAGVQCVWLYRCAVCVAVPVCSVCGCNIAAADERSFNVLIKQTERTLEAITIPYALQRQFSNAV